MNLVPTHLRHHSAGAIFKNIQDSKPNLRSTLRRCLKGVESGCKLTCASRCAALASKPSNGSDDSYPDTARGLANGFFSFLLCFGVFKRGFGQMSPCTCDNFCKRMRPHHD